MHNNYNYFDNFINFLYNYYRKRTREFSKYNQNMTLIYSKKNFPQF